MGVISVVLVGGMSGIDGNTSVVYQFEFGRASSFIHSPITAPRNGSIAPSAQLWKSIATHTPSNANATTLMPT
jgi:hypothetical protein